MGRGRYGQDHYTPNGAKLARGAVYPFPSPDEVFARCRNRVIWQRRLRSPARLGWRADRGDRTLHHQLCDFSPRGHCSLCALGDSVSTVRPRAVRIWLPRQRSVQGYRLRIPDPSRFGRRRRWLCRGLGAIAGAGRGKPGHWCGSGDSCRPGNGGGLGFHRLSTGNEGGDVFANGPTGQGRGPAYPGCL